MEGVTTASLPAHLRQSLFAHRFLTDRGMVRGTDFEIVQYDNIPMLQPAKAPTPGSLRKGMSFYVVFSNAPDVLASAHLAAPGYRASSPCYAYPLQSLPDTLVMTIDSVKESTSANAPIIAHMSLTPKAPMSYAAFSSAVESWHSVPCRIAGTGEESMSDSGDSGCGLGDEHKCSFSRRSAFVLRMLAGLVPPGGSPGPRGHGVAC